jgi:DDE superfamily endonuclease
VVLRRWRRGPTTGERCFLEWPYLKTDTVQLFVDALAHAFPDSLNILLLDNCRAPSAQQLTLPANVRLVFFPPYGPELNPIERFWRDLKDDLAWQQFMHVAASPDDVTSGDAPTRLPRGKRSPGTPTWWMP